MDRTPIILTGPAGCGKSHWIRSYAESRAKQLIVCPCRKDRTLRDGRQLLHLWGRRTEPSIIWLEGADDLTPEAQAFLRRILETHAPDVQFILECRDAGKLQEPIRSRCVIRTILRPTYDELEKCFSSNTDIKSILSSINPSELSFRRVQQCIFLSKNHPDIWCSIRERSKEEADAVTNVKDDSKIMEYIGNAYSPEIFIEKLLNDNITNHTFMNDYGDCLECSGSLWAFLGSALSA